MRYIYGNLKLYTNYGENIDAIAIMYNCDNKVVTTNKAYEWISQWAESEEDSIVSFDMGNELIFRLVDSESKMRDVRIVSKLILKGE